MEIPATLFKLTCQSHFSSLGSWSGKYDWWPVSYTIPLNITIPKPHIYNFSLDSFLWRIYFVRSGNKKKKDKNNKYWLNWGKVSRKYKVVF